MNSEINKENVQVGGRKPLSTISNQSIMFKRSIGVKESLKPIPAKAAISKSTQTEVHYVEAGCGTSDQTAQDMISALTGGPLNESYYESLAEQRREALEVTLDENEELNSKLMILLLSLFFYSIKITIQHQNYDF